ncbi:hypothetical protein ACFVX6_15500 [Streptomyces sp. NPDC058289]|uniref:hypothetical protein n=1 Tax=Streptomyces sp. NPDC058289 TaxID=3346425 RepID=UPI0036EBBD65
MAGVGPARAGPQAPAGRRHPLNGVDLGDADQDAAYGLVIDVAAGNEEGIGRIGERLRALAR